MLWLEVHPFYIASLFLFVSPFKRFCARSCCPAQLPHFLSSSSTGGRPGLAISLAKAFPRTSLCSSLAQGHTWRWVPVGRELGGSDNRVSRALVPLVSPFPGVFDQPIFVRETNSGQDKHSEVAQNLKLSRIHLTVIKAKVFAIQTCCLLHSIFRHTFRHGSSLACLTPSKLLCRTRSTRKVWEKPSQRFWRGQHLVPSKDLCFFSHLLFVVHLPLDYDLDSLSQPS